MALIGTTNSGSVTIPHEPGEWMIFNRLSAGQLEVAAQARQTRAFANMRAMGGDVLVALKDTKVEDLKAENPEAKKADDDPLNKYDAAELLKAGIAKWSYGETVPADPFNAIDPDTAEWAAREIANRSKRRTETETKNG